MLKRLLWRKQSSIDWSRRGAAVGSGSPRCAGAYGKLTTYVIYEHAHADAPT